MRYVMANAFRANSDKAAGFPPVVMDEHPKNAGAAVGGFYVSPRRGEMEVSGRFHDLRRGLIVAREDATVAHEWRHHWQWFHGWQYDGVGWPPKSYWGDIRRYFRESRAELDALLYEIDWVPADYARQWLEVVLSP